MRTSQTVMYSALISADELEGDAELYVSAWDDGEVSLTAARVDDVGQTLNEVIVILTPKQARDVQHSLLRAINTAMRSADQGGES